MISLKIAKTSPSAVIDFACDELIRYLRQIDSSCLIECRCCYDNNAATDGCITVGLCDMQNDIDDGIFIDIKDGAGQIIGQNERSVLFAVYRVLYEIGCRFYRYCATGADTDGCEYVPKRTLTLDDFNIHVSERPSYRHRCICIEGSDAYEHIEAIINWLPKVGLNGYYVQFKTPHTFFNNWSEHIGNPYLSGNRLTREEVDAIYIKVREDIKKRGLSLHAVGHGWTCEPLGLDGSGWYEAEVTLDDEKKELLAMVNGERAFYQKVPLNTNLCYSNPKVQELITDAIADYCEENPDVDYLHFWLADSRNAQCECVECKKMRPSDYYVQMLNSLDKKLTAKYVKTRIVFLIYYDLLWKSQIHKIENTDRFVLMFAPITRTYSTSFTDVEMNDVPAPPEYKRNNFTLPRDVPSNLAFLKDWQRDFAGDSFDFDYHLMWDHVRDVGYCDCARILHKDMCNLYNIGLNGMVSCQIQRASLPSNLPMYAMAKALWDKDSDFDTITSEYFSAEYKGQGRVVQKYLCTLSEYICLPYIRRERDALDSKLNKQYSEAKKFLVKFRNDVIVPNLSESISWKYLLHHSYMTEFIFSALEARTVGVTVKMDEYVKQLSEYAWKNEPELHRVLDVNNYLYVIRATLMPKN